MMRVTRTSGLNDNVAITAETILNQALVYGTGCQGRMHWQGVPVNITVGEHNNDRTAGNGL